MINQQLLRQSILYSWNVVLMVCWAYNPAFGFNPSARGSHLIGGNAAPARLLRLQMSSGNSQRRFSRHRKRRWKTEVGAAQRAGHRRVKLSGHEWRPLYDLEIECTQSDEQVRFHLVPENNWDGILGEMGCNANNTINWWGHAPVPQAPNPCWLLPVKDNVSVVVAQRQGELREAGWKVLTCEPKIIATLCNKSSFRELAEKIGKLHLLPAHWSSPAEATYPCILKAAIGDYGKGTHIVNSIEEVHEIAGKDLGSHWVLQELITGCLECSTSLLVVEGEILDVICTEYEYETISYVWPNVGEVERSSSNQVPIEHLADMSSFLRGYSGICNFNYKIQWGVKNFSFGGQMKIFEVNPRVGGDLGCDVPRDMACALFERLDELSQWETEGRFWQQMPPSLLDRMIGFSRAITMHQQRCGWQQC
mmetsp:Transcript_141601/g.244888  ORF Transcript_141601/g.244888 Transcript_141601/m.244888 type:complete len:421 (+) Transcript_141601:147-1409(+)